MDKRYKYYFKILNHELFGGMGTEGYMHIFVKNKYDNPISELKSTIGISDDVEIIGITEEEYIKATEE